MDQENKVTFSFNQYEAKNINNFSEEDQVRLMNVLAHWKKRVIEAAVDHHLSEKYPEETFHKTWLRIDE